MKRGIATAGKIEDSETLRISREWIDSLSSGTPFFLGLNLQNTHFSYVIPEGGEEPFQPSTIDFPTVYYGWPKDKVEEVRNRYFNAYDQEPTFFPNLSKNLPYSSNKRGFGKNVGS